MAVFAEMKDGAEVELARHLGATGPEVLGKLTEESLTGSAVGLDDAELETADGRRVRYGDVRRLTAVEP